MDHPLIFYHAHDQRGEQEEMLAKTITIFIILVMGLVMIHLAITSTYACVFVVYSHHGHGYTRDQPPGSHHDLLYRCVGLKARKKNNKMMRASRSLSSL